MKVGKVVSNFPSKLEMSKRNLKQIKFLPNNLRKISAKYGEEIQKEVDKTRTKH